MKEVKIIVATVNVDKEIVKEEQQPFASSVTLAEIPQKGNLLIIDTKAYAVIDVVVPVGYTASVPSVIVWEVSEEVPMWYKIL